MRITVANFYIDAFARVARFAKGNSIETFVNVGINGTRHSRSRGNGSLLILKFQRDAFERDVVFITNISDEHFVSHNPKIDKLSRLINASIASGSSRGSDVLIGNGGTDTVSSGHGIDFVDAAEVDVAFLVTQELLDRLDASN